MRFGLLASLALHVLLLAVWWTKTPSMPWQLAGASGTRAMEVHFLSGHDTPATEPAIAQMPVAGEMAAEATSASVEAEPRLQSGNPTVFAFTEPPYIPAGELDERPSPQAPVVIPFPETSMLAGKAAGILVLYIGADGRVDRVEVDESNLPADFERAAIDTFLRVRMHPGILNGQPSRARTRVLVEFEQH